MRAVPGTDVLIVSLGSTAGLRASDGELAASMRRAGAQRRDRDRRARSRGCARSRWTDWRWARAARAAAARGHRRPRSARDRLLDDDRRAALAAAGRDPLRRARRGDAPGPPRLLAAPARAPPAARGAAAGRDLAGHARRDAASRTRPSLVVPIAVEPSGLGAPWAQRDIARSPTPPIRTRRASTACSRRGRRRGARARRSSSPASTRRACRRSPEGVTRGGRARAATPTARCCCARKLFVTAPRREDHGIAQLEALADGCLLVTTPAPGPYAALPIARELDARLVTEDLAAGDPRGARRAGAALRRALDPAARAVHARLDRPRRESGAAAAAARVMPRA